MHASIHVFKQYPVGRSHCGCVCVLCVTGDIHVVIMITKKKKKNVASSQSFTVRHDLMNTEMFTVSKVQTL